MRRHLLLISDALEVSFQTTTKSLRRFAGVSFGRVTSLGVSTTIFKRVRLNGFEIAEQLTLDVSERCWNFVTCILMHNFEILYLKTAKMFRTEHYSQILSTYIFLSSFRTRISTNNHSVDDRQVLVCLIREYRKWLERKGVTLQRHNETGIPPEISVNMIIYNLRNIKIFILKFSLSDFKLKIINIL